MKLKNIVLSLSLLSASMVHASSLHFSPELKIGAYHGFGMQAGITDVANFDAVYLSYSHLWYESDRYDESVDSYRVGIQQSYGSKSLHGFQAEIGFATYDGDKTRSGVTENKSATGLSIGGAYVYQATSVLALRAGADMNIFDHNETCIPYDTTINFNLGAIITF